MQYVYFCPNCNNLECYDFDNSDLDCSECSKKLVPLNIDMEAWNELSNDEMLSIIDKSRNKGLKKPVFKPEIDNDETTQQSIVNKKRNKIKIFIVIAIILFIIAAVFIVIWLFKGAKSEVVTEELAVPQETEELKDDNDTSQSTPSENTVTNEIKEEAQTEEDKPEPRTSTDFRNTCWGDSMETVKKYEEAKLVESDDTSLSYADTLTGMDVYVVYEFKNDKLVNAGYLLTQSFTTGGQYLSLLENWKNMLIKNYGEPSPDSPGRMAYESESQIELAGEGRALEYGYTAYAYDWENSRTHIRLGLISTNYEPHMLLKYDEINYYRSEDEDLKDF